MQKDVTNLARAVLETVMAMARAMESKTRQVGIAVVPAHFFILQTLAIQPHSQRQLAKRILVSPATMSATLDVLEKRGWVTRQRSQVDRRMIVIEITPVGLLVLQEIHGHAVAQLSEVLTVLSDVEVEKVKEGLAILKQLFSIQTAIPKESLNEV